MFIYANLIGNWTELSEDDTICGTPAYEYVEEEITNTDNTNRNNGFLQVIHNDKKYHIHYSQIQWII